MGFRSNKSNMFLFSLKQFLKKEDTTAFSKLLTAGGIEFMSVLSACDCASIDVQVVLSG